MHNLTRTEATEVIKAAKAAVSRTFSRYGRKASPCHLHDLSADTVVKVMASYDATRGTLASAAYSYAANLAVDFLRGRKYAGGSKDVLVTDSADGDDSGSFIEGHADSAPSALASMIRAEKEEQMADALADLKPHELDAIQAGFSGEVLTGGQRIAKMRAVTKMKEMFR